MARYWNTGDFKQPTEAEIRSRASATKKKEKFINGIATHEINDEFARMFRGKIVFCPMKDKLIKTSKHWQDVKVYDFLNREEMQVCNAVPTAEGAIEIAISETPFTLHNSNCLVLGYGKVGKILAKSLDALGAKTYVSARKYADLALIEGHGCYPLTVSEAKSRLGEFDIIFNTVPALILSKNELLHIRRDTLVIDLASKPGGVDFETAKELGIHVVWALSLPGRVAPVTAGIIIKDTIINMLREEV